MDTALLTLVARAVDQLEAIVATVTPADLNRPTPCPSMPVGELVGHVVGGLSGFADVAEGRPLLFGPGPDVPGDPHGRDAALRTAADRMLAGFGAPGMLERTFDMPWGPTTGAQLMGFELIELLTHGWDLARAMGHDPAIVPDLAEAALAGAQMWVDDSVRNPQMFGPEVPVDRGASALERLVGFLGRDPSWSPTAALTAGASGGSAPLPVSRPG
jgi:uncharacterized protein (TIGR03086 family)